MGVGEMGVGKGSRERRGGGSRKGEEVGIRKGRRI